MAIVGPERISNWMCRSLEIFRSVSCCRKRARMPKPETGRISEAVALTKAVVNIADRLEISQKALASIIGLSEPTISRMRKGTFVLKRNSGKAFELAQLLVQLWDLLDRLVAWDEVAARAWLAGENVGLGGRPIDRIQTVRGLAEVVGYLRARSSL